MDVRARDLDVRELLGADGGREVGGRRVAEVRRGHFFEIRKRPSARCGRPERSNVSTASSAEHTSGSPWRLNEGLSTAPIPVRASNSRITRWYPGFHASSTMWARAVPS